MNKYINISAVSATKIVVLAPFKMKNTFPNFAFPAADIRADLSSRATVRLCPLSPYRQSHKLSMCGQANGTKDNLSIGKRRMSCEQPSSVRGKWLTL